MAESAGELLRMLEKRSEGTTLAPGVLAMVMMLAVVEGLVEAVSRLVEDHDLRKQLGRGAREAVETRYTLDQWNAALKRVFDKARAAG